MSNFTFFIGIDISKSQLDIALWQDGALQMSLALANKTGDIGKFIKQLRKRPGFQMSKAIFCMEHSGIYDAHLLNVLQKAKASISLIAATEIKNSLGLQRGKNDQVDARRIAEYAARFEDKLRLWVQPRKVIEQLQALCALRRRLVDAKNQLATPLAEAQQFLPTQDVVLLKKHSQGPIAALEKALEAVEDKIQQLILDDQDLKQIFNSVTSVPGVGPVVATEVIVQTNEFKDFEQSKKFACHAGVAPFDYRSGSSIRGKSRVSHKANKRLKTILHMAAMSAIRADNDLRQYYLRKVQEGKNKLSVLNAVRNKIIHRIFAVATNRTMYDKNLNFSLVKP